jgi:hypothetical protein
LASPQISVSERKQVVAAQHSFGSEE